MRIKEDLIENEQRIAAAVKTLKSEFIGIDKQIDEIMNIVRVWYLYPELQSRPCVVNVFGMSGCGKTSLIRRIVSLLDMEDRLNYINFANISEMTSAAVEEELAENVKQDVPNNIFVYDEFQYAATINAEGEEKDNKNGLKPFWELLDTGILHRSFDMWEMNSLSQFYLFMERANAKCPIILENGLWVNIRECFSVMSELEIGRCRYAFNQDLLAGDEEDEEIKSNRRYYQKQARLYGGKASYDDFFIGTDRLEKLKDAYTAIYGKKIDEVGIVDIIKGMDYNMFGEWLRTMIFDASKGINLDCHSSIIFVIANLDEAYEVAFDVNPDMSPDQFHKITEKISVVDIKQALQKRFRNEQIARLGNTHIIYPAFNSKAFRAIISQQLDRYAVDAEKLTDLRFKFDKKICKAIYDEAVYPTHGTRPVFSTINEVVKSKLPSIVSSINNDGLTEAVAEAEYSMVRGKTAVKVFDKCGKLLKTYIFEDKWRLKALRENKQDEEQSNCAVHESGHFAVYTYLFSSLPEKVVSRSTDKSFGGFMMGDINDDIVSSKSELLRQMKVALGGYAAEKIVFGDMGMSSGSSNDLERATTIAGRIIRQYGLDGEAVRSTVIKNPTLEFACVDSEEESRLVNDKIKEMVDNQLFEVKQIISQPEVWSMFVKASKYLAQHPSLPKSEMSRLFDEMTANRKDEKPHFSYKEIVEGLNPTDPAASTVSDTLTAADLKQPLWSL